MSKKDLSPTLPQTGTLKRQKRQKRKNAKNAIPNLKNGVTPVGCRALVSALRAPTCTQQFWGVTPTSRKRKNSKIPNLKKRRDSPKLPGSHLPRVNEKTQKYLTLKNASATTTARQRQQQQQRQRHTVRKNKDDVDDQSKTLRSL